MLYGAAPPDDDEFKCAAGMFDCFSLHLCESQCHASVTALPAQAFVAFEAPRVTIIQ